MRPIEKWKIVIFFWLFTGLFQQIFLFFFFSKLQKINFLSFTVFFLFLFGHKLHLFLKKNSHTWWKPRTPNWNVIRVIELKFIVCKFFQKQRKTSKSMLKPRLRTDWNNFEKQSFWQGCGLPLPPPGPLLWEAKCPGAGGERPQPCILNFFLSVQIFVLVYFGCLCAASGKTKTKQDLNFNLVLEKNNFHIFVPKVNVFVDLPSSVTFGCLFPSPKIFWSVLWLFVRCFSR